MDAALNMMMCGLHLCNDANPAENVDLEEKQGTS